MQLERKCDDERWCDDEWKPREVHAESADETFRASGVDEFARTNSPVKDRESTRAAQ